jgi:hypothetical protein
MRIKKAKIEAEKGVAQMIPPLLRPIAQHRTDRDRHTPLDQFEILQLFQIGREMVLAH